MASRRSKSSAEEFGGCALERMASSDFQDELKALQKNSGAGHLVSDEEVIHSIALSFYLISVVQIYFVDDYCIWCLSLWHAYLAQRTTCIKSYVSINYLIQKQLPFFSNSSALAMWC